MTLSYARGLRAVVVLALMSGAAFGMVFKSEVVKAQWDTWCYFHDGTFYLYYLITERSPGEGFGVATSRDGVHWKDHGWAIRASDKMVFYLGTGAVWKAPDFATSGRFICNYSEWRKDVDGKERQNIYFAWSKDLIHWTKYGDEFVFPIDARHYKPHGRWDCIFPMPRAEGGYAGTWTATPATGSREGGIGIGVSEDGLRWKALPAPMVEPAADESGAFARIGGRIHAMFGAEFRMDSYEASDVAGPYRRSRRNPVLLQRGDSYFARFLEANGELLVNHHVMSGAKHGDREITYVAPFKSAKVDAAGTLRWSYWKGNDALKGRAANAEGELDLTQGFVAEGTLRFGNAPARIAMKVDGDLYEIEVFKGGVTEMRSKRGVKRVDREWPFGESARFRLLARRGMVEFYLDDQFMECSTLRAPGARSARLDGSAGDLHVWAMSL